MAFYISLRYYIHGSICSVKVVNIQKLVSCTAQVIRNNQNILNALKLFMVRKDLRINPRSTNIGGQNECEVHSASSSNICYSESFFKADSYVSTAYNGNLYERTLILRNDVWNKYNPNPQHLSW